jgi:hypothetical protein
MPCRLASPNAIHSLALLFTEAEAVLALDATHVSSTHDTQAAKNRSKMTPIHSLLFRQSLTTFCTDMGIVLMWTTTRLGKG